MNESNERKTYTKKEFWKFAAPSALGVFLFLFPIWQNGSITIPIGILIDWIKAGLGDVSKYVLLVGIVLSFVTTIIMKLFKPKFLTERKLMREFFDVGIGQIVLRSIGAVFAIILGFNLEQFSIIVDPNTGGTVLGLVITAFVSMFVCCYALPLVMDYGIMDLTGALFKKITRPLFKLPGRSTVDLITSWVGGNSSGILLTINQYEKNYYTAREATIISTMFAAVSIPFCLVIAQMLGVGSMFAEFYLTITVVGMISTIIMVRIPPLSIMPNTYYSGEAKYSEQVQGNLSAFQWGKLQAIEKAKSAGNIKDIFISGTRMFGNLLFTLAPIVMTIGVIALILTEYTSIFNIISTPMIYVLEFLGVEEAAAAAPATLIGFGDMFLPAIIASNITSLETKFIIGVLSLVQIIYMSEMGAIIIGSKLPVNLLHLLIIFLEKTLIALPMIVLMSKLFF